MGKWQCFWCSNYWLPLILKREEYEKNFKIKLDESLWKSPDYNITQICDEITLRRLGETMNHCVGGYWREVSTGGSIILDIKDSKDMKGRWTMEIVHDIYTKDGEKEVKYSVRQVYGKFNRHAPQRVHNLGRMICRRIEGIADNQWIKNLIFQRQERNKQERRRMY